MISVLVQVHLALVVVDSSQSVMPLSILEPKLLVNTD